MPRAHLIASGRRRWAKLPLRTTYNSIGQVATTIDALNRVGSKYPSCEAMADGLRTFARSYSGEWRLLNRSCRDFQYEAMEDVGAVDPAFTADPL
jgi:hypothetical protein